MDFFPRNETPELLFSHTQRGNVRVLKKFVARRPEFRVNYWAYFGRLDDLIPEISAPFAVTLQKGKKQMPSEWSGDGAMSATRPGPFV